MFKLDLGKKCYDSMVKEVNSVLSILDLKMLKHRLETTTPYDDLFRYIVHQVYVSLDVISLLDLLTLQENFNEKTAEEYNEIASLKTLLKLLEEDDFNYHKLNQYIQGKDYDSYDEHAVKFKDLIVLQCDFDSDKAQSYEEQAAHFFPGGIFEGV